ncbi:MAG TPA: peptidoglycan editing factor PgeF [Burkholderiaceae bacterium]|nr:peptidoglycan editing factor PgeF [Burkholderiaceae bacterium]
MTRGFDADWLVPEWHVPGVGAVMTTRQGGVSVAPFDTLNLRAGQGDDPVAVAQNQRRLADAIGAAPVWLTQVHGAAVVPLTASDQQPGAPVHRADASFTVEPGVVCAAQVADCLPVLFAAPGARGVAAAHAGWRGLAGGVLDATIAALCEATNCEPDELQAWLGACIGPRRFEVGADVLQAFGADPDRRENQPGFAASQSRGEHAKWLADLPWLARQRLAAAGVRAVSGGTWCTVEAPSRFFSYRRDGVTGRMAAAVWIERR